MRWRKGGRRRTHKLAGVIGPEVLREEGKNPERAPLPALPHTCTPVFPLTQDIMVQHRITPPFSYFFFSSFRISFSSYLIHKIQTPIFFFIFLDLLIL